MGNYFGPKPTVTPTVSAHTFPVGSVAGAASGLVGSVVGAIAQGHQNKKNREFAARQAKKQYENSIKFWRMQNRYNLPSNRMARLKAAGLNPNLVYGNGADTTAGAIHVPSQANWHGEAIRPNLSGVVSQALSTAQQFQALKNAKKQGNVLDAETTLKTNMALKALSEFHNQGLNYDIRSSQQKYLESLLRSNAKKAQLTNSTMATQLKFLKKSNPKKYEVIRANLKRLHLLNKAQSLKNPLIGFGNNNWLGSLIKTAISLFGADWHNAL